MPTSSVLGATRGRPFYFVDVPLPFILLISALAVQQGVRAETNRQSILSLVFTALPTPVLAGSGSKGRSQPCLQFYLEEQYDAPGGYKKLRCAAAVAKRMRFRHSVTPTYRWRTFS